MNVSDVSREFLANMKPGESVTVYCDDFAGELNLRNKCSQAGKFSGGEFKFTCSQMSEEHMFLVTKIANI